MGREKVSLKANWCYGGIGVFCSYKVLVQWKIWQGLQAYSNEHCCFMVCLCYV